MTDHNKKKKVSFLFGAGAELAFNLPSGGDYLLASLFGNETKQGVVNALKDFFKNEYGYFGKTFKYSTYTYSNYDPVLRNSVISRLRSKAIEFNDYKDEIMATLLKSEINELKDEGIIPEDYSYSNNKSKDLKNELLSTFKEALEGKKEYEKPDSRFIRSLFSEENNGEPAIDMNVGVSGLLDGYFHTVISPKKYGPIKFTKLMNYYWMCYFAIVEPIVKDSKWDGFKEYLDADGKLNYSAVLNDFGGFTEKLFQIDKGKTYKDKDNYYSLLEMKLDKEKYLVKSVATTNYYNFIEMLSGEEHCYLNGRLDMIEFPEKLEVKSAQDSITDNKNLFFPFIFGQSLVKPIVDSFQIEQLNKWKEAIMESDLLVILGYRLNEDDNHINGFIHKYVDENKVMIIVTDEKNEKMIEKRIRCKSDNIKYLKVDYHDGNEHIVSELIKMIEEY